MSENRVFDLTQPVLVARGIRKTYEGPVGPLHILEGVDLEVPRGMLLAITGASGAGKTTLLNILGGLDHSTAGTLEIGGQRVETMGERERCRLRAERLGFVFQFHHLLPEFTAEENVMMPLLLAGRSPDEARARAREVLDTVGLRGRMLHQPAELSGGEAQRVAVARALASEPELVLADEPSGNLDTATAGELHELLASLARERHQTFVLVTHNERLAAMADRVMRLESGRLSPA
ncbi:MAG: ABC transporter ATP-binding protein [Candidatus Eisenbacteria bacterium]|nr:ABC transporter ATP-binding protein [Candidatus Eisenbacteria bacterium]